MEARPHLNPALKKLQAAIARILTTPLSIGVGLEDFGGRQINNV
jgi:hypothetical protein